MCKINSIRILVELSGGLKRIICGTAFAPNASPFNAAYLTPQFDGTDKEKNMELTKIYSLNGVDQPYRCVHDPYYDTIFNPA